MNMNMNLTEELGYVRANLVMALYIIEHNEEGLSSEVVDRIMTAIDILDKDILDEE